jgi:hypothetical protein
MDLAAKLTIARTAIDSISRHDDEDAAVREAQLDLVLAHVAAERAAMRDRIAARVRELNAATGAPARS